MRETGSILFTCILVTVSGCSSSTTNQPGGSSQSTPASSSTQSPVNVATPSQNPAPEIAKLKVDPCKLLTSPEIQAVQGEPLKETTPSVQSAADFVTMQCYYELPTPSNSISLTLTLRDPEKKGGQSVKDFWEKTFAKSEEKSKERKKDRSEEKNKSAGEEEEEAAAEPVRGIGDEAFWSASRVGGALYVLKGDRFIRISVGGKGDVES